MAKRAAKAAGAPKEKRKKGRPSNADKAARAAAPAPASPGPEPERPQTEAAKISMISGKKLKNLLNDKASTRRAISEQFSGPLGERIKKAVEQDHLDRPVFNFISGLWNLDQRTLARRLATLYHCLDVSGLEKRATDQGDMFEAAVASTRGQPPGISSAPGEEPDEQGDDEQGDPDEADADAETSGSGTMLPAADRGDADRVRSTAKTH